MQGRLTQTKRSRQPPNAAAARDAAVLMEVVFALALLSLAGAVMSGGLSASFRAVERGRLVAQAADMAVTKMSEIETGQLQAANDGPNSYADENLQDWTWQIVAAPLDDQPLQDVTMQEVQVVISHQPSRTLHRLSQVMPVKEPLP